MLARPAGSQSYDHLSYGFDLPNYIRRSIHLGLATGYWLPGFAFPARFTDGQYPGSTNRD